MTSVNKAIADDSVNLGPGFRIGHSFFCPTAAPDDWLDWYIDVIRHEITPLLREYWFDDPEKAEQWADQLLAP